MITKLRSAGLGFYVRETETQQKLGALPTHIIGGSTTAYSAIIAGRIPLRELVYRVIDLPPSMRPLVYDFGQLNTDTERDYTNQIVRDHVSVMIKTEYFFINCFRLNPMPNFVGRTVLLLVL